MSRKQNDRVKISRDILWKGIIEDLFEDFLYYFYPKWTKTVLGFTKPFEFLDKELSEISPSENNTKRYADKLIKVYTKNEEEQWVMAHVEVQGYDDTNFGERMFTYLYHIKNRWNKKIFALAIFTNANPKHQVKAYHYKYQNTELIYKFGAFRIQEKTTSELDISDNPFSLIMLTAKKALQKQELSDSKQLVWKVALVRKLKAESYSSKRIRRILNFIRYYVEFRNQDKYKKLDESSSQIIKQRKNMSIEELILEEAKRQGLEQGLRKGLKQGLEKVRQEKIRNIQNALRRGKLIIEEIAEDFEASKDFALKIREETH